MDCLTNYLWRTHILTTTSIFLTIVRFDLSDFSFLISTFLDLNLDFGIVQKKTNLFYLLRNPVICYFYLSFLRYKWKIPRIGSREKPNWFLQFLFGQLIIIPENKKKTIKFWHECQRKKKKTCFNQFKFLIRRFSISMLAFNITLCSFQQTY